MRGGSASAESSLLFAASAVAQSCIVKGYTFIGYHVSCAGRCNIVNSTPQSLAYAACWSQLDVSQASPLLHTFEALALVLHTRTKRT